MKNYMVLCAGVSAALLLASCGKSSESAYRKAYEKAKAQETAQQINNAAQQVDTVQMITPVTTKPANETVVVDNSDNVSVRQERVTLIDGAGLKNFSVVVGSFTLKANAEGLQQRLKNAGNQAQIVKNEERNMYRVVVSTFDNKNEAVNSRNAFRATYPDAWLLFNQK